MFQGVNVISIPVKDLDASRDFYQRILGFGEPRYDLPDDGWIEFSAGGTGGNIALTPAAQCWTPAEAGVVIVLNVHNCTSTVATLRAAGVRCDDPQTFPGYVTFADFWDISGNRLQMCSAPEE